MIAASQPRGLLICLCLTTVIMAVYWPVYNFEFVGYDDDQYVTDNRHVQDGLTSENLLWALSTRQTANWHPLTWVSLILDCRLFGMWAGGYHLVNVLLHVVNTLLLFAVFNRMTAAPWRSAFVASLFALHPLHVESVAWVAERKDVLSTCFLLLTIWAYIRYIERPTGWRYLSTLGLYALGLMSKPMGVTLPFVLLLLDYWPLGRTRWAKPATGESVKAPPRQLLKEKLPFLALAAVSCVVTYWAQQAGGTVVPMVNLSLRMRIANALLSYVGYMGQTFWPTRLAVFYPLHEMLPAAVMGAAVGLVGITAVVIWRARRAPWLATGWFWYLGMLVPVIGLVQVGAQSMADRYTYVPLIGLFIMLCWSVPCGEIRRRNLKPVASVVAAAVLMVCVVLSVVQVRYWKDTATLFDHALKVTRDNWLAHCNLGMALAQAGRIEEAIGQYQQALRIEPDCADAHYNLGVFLSQTGRIEEAIWHYGQAVRLKPDDADAHNNLGLALQQVGKIENAISHYEQALRINPDDVEVHCNLGMALAQAGRIEEAIGHYEQALRIKPDLVAAQKSLARLRSGR